MLEFVDVIYFSQVKGLFQWPEKEDLFLLYLDVYLYKRDPEFLILLKY